MALGLWRWQHINRTKSYPYLQQGGAYFVTLTVKSDTNLTDSVTKIVIISPPPKYPPVADFTYKVINGTTVEFNANLSYDEDGYIKYYIWDFGDGTPANTTTNPIIIHKYKKRGFIQLPWQL